MVDVLEALMRPGRVFFIPFLKKVEFFRREIQNHIKYIYRHNKNISK